MSPTQMTTMTVAELMQRWPRTVRVFNSRRMACPGCVMAPFMTVADAAGSYRMDETELAAELAAASGDGSLHVSPTEERVDEH